MSYLFCVIKHAISVTQCRTPSVIAEFSTTSTSSLPSLTSWFAAVLRFIPNCTLHWGKQSIRPYVPICQAFRSYNRTFQLLNLTIAKLLLPLHLLARRRSTTMFNGRRGPPNHHLHGVDSPPSLPDAAKLFEGTSHLDNAPTEKKSHDNLVDFTPNDPGDPRNWPAWRKWLISLSLTVVNFATLWNTSGYTTVQIEFPM